MLELRVQIVGGDLDDFAESNSNQAQLINALDKGFRRIGLYLGHKRRGLYACIDLEPLKACHYDFYCDLNCLLERVS